MGLGRFLSIRLDPVADVEGDMELDKGILRFVQRVKVWRSTFPSSLIQAMSTPTQNALSVGRASIFISRHMVAGSILMNLVRHGQNTRVPTIPKCGTAYLRPRAALDFLLGLKAARINLHRP